MAIVDGKKVKARYTKLKLNELSSVDRPAQPGAKMVIMKRHVETEEGTDSMAKTVDELNADLAKANTDIATLKSTTASLETQLAAANKAKDDFMAERDKAKEECATAKAALVTATDEVIKVEGTEVKKSEVGEAQFALTKALISRADMATFEKRAEVEFGNVVGTAAEKALVLKGLETLDEPTKKAAEAILLAAEKMTAAGFDRLGSGGIHSNPTQKAAADTFTAKVAEIEKRDSVTRSVALTKARAEFPDEFAAYNGTN